MRKWETLKPPITFHLTLIKFNLSESSQWPDSLPASPHLSQSLSFHLLVMLQPPSYPYFCSLYLILLSPDVDPAWGLVLIQMSLLEQHFLGQPSHMLTHHVVSFFSYNSALSGIKLLTYSYITCLPQIKYNSVKKGLMPFLFVCFHLLASFSCSLECWEYSQY